MEFKFYILGIYREQSITIFWGFFPIMIPMSRVGQQWGLNFYMGIYRKQFSSKKPQLIHVIIQVVTCVEAFFSSVVLKLSKLWFLRYDGAIIGVLTLHKNIQRTIFCSKTIRPGKHVYSALLIKRVPTYGKRL